LSASDILSNYKMDLVASIQEISSPDFVDPNTGTVKPHGKYPLGFDLVDPSTKIDGKIGVTYEMYEVIKKRSQTNNMIKENL